MAIQGGRTKKKSKGPERFVRGEDLPACEVVLGSGRRIAYLYFANDRVAVLLGNVRPDAEYGSVDARVDAHYDPDADVTVLPRSRVRELNVLRRQ